MFKIYDLETARKTILRRKPINTTNYPPALIAGVERLFGEGVGPYEAVMRILSSVSNEGDAALQRWSKTLDKTDLEDFRIPPETFAAAYNNLPPALTQAMTIAAQRIRDFHQRQPLPNWTTTEMGGILGQRPRCIVEAQH